MHEGHRITQFHHVIHEHLDEICSGDFEFNLREDRYVGGVQRGILQGEFDFALAKHRSLVRRNQAHTFDELAKACGPTIKNAKSARDYRQLRHADEINDANEEEITVGLLADFFAQQ